MLIDVYQLVNATLMGGREGRGTLSIGLMRFTCCSSEVLQLFMTEVLAIELKQQNRRNESES